MTGGREREKERELRRDGTSEEIRKREDGRGGGPVDPPSPDSANSLASRGSSANSFAVCCA